MNHQVINIKSIGRGRIKGTKTYQEIRRKHRVLEIISVKRDPEESGLREETGIFLDEVVDVVLRHEMRDVVLAIGYL